MHRKALVALALVSPLASPLPAAAGSIEDAVAAIQRGDHAEALHLLRPLANAGDANAHANLGWVHERGQGVARNFAEAAAWYRKAADQGHAGAQNNLGRMYEQGQGVPQDPAQAASWYRKSAEQGFAGAQSNLGRMYHYGQGISRDPAQAVAWYRRAADQEQVAAQQSLALMYEKGEGVPQDPAQAAVWYRKAADQGVAAAQHSLGVAYHGGRGVPQDLAQAATWLRKAADQTHAGAQAALGIMHANGQGVPRDRAEALRLLRSAVAAGDETARTELARVEAERPLEARPATAKVEAALGPPTAREAEQMRREADLATMERRVADALQRTPGEDERAFGERVSEAAKRILRPGWEKADRSVQARENAMNNHSGYQRQEQLRAHDRLRAQADREEQFQIEGRFRAVIARARQDEEAARRVAELGIVRPPPATPRPATWAERVEEERAKVRLWCEQNPDECAREERRVAAQEARQRLEEQRRGQWQVAHESQRLCQPLPEAIQGATDPDEALAVMRQSDPDAGYHRNGAWRMRDRDGIVREQPRVIIETTGGSVLLAKDYQACVLWFAAARR